MNTVFASPNFPVNNRPFSSLLHTAYFVCTQNNNVKWKLSPHLFFTCRTTIKSKEAVPSWMTERPPNGSRNSGIQAAIGKCIESQWNIWLLRDYFTCSNNLCACKMWCDLLCRRVRPDADTSGLLLPCCAQCGSRPGVAGARWWTSMWWWIRRKCEDG